MWCGVCRQDRCAGGVARLLRAGKQDDKHYETKENRRFTRRITVQQEIDNSQSLEGDALSALLQQVRDRLPCAGRPRVTPAA